MTRIASARVGLRSERSGRVDSRRRPRWQSCRSGCGWGLHPAGTPSFARRLVGSSGTATPWTWQASAHMIPGPPALVTIATLPRVARAVSPAARRRRASPRACRCGSPPPARTGRRRWSRRRPTAVHRCANPPRAPRQPSVRPCPPQGGRRIKAIAVVSASILVATRATAGMAGKAQRRPSSSDRSSGCSGRPGSTTDRRPRTRPRIR